MLVARCIESYGRWTDSLQLSKPLHGHAPTKILVPDVVKKGLDTTAQGCESTWMS